MNKEEIVNTLLASAIINEEVAAILLDKMDASAIPQFEWPVTKADTFNPYIQMHLNHRKAKKDTCGCTTCTCSLSGIGIN